VKGIERCLGILPVRSRSLVKTVLMAAMSKGLFVRIYRVDLCLCERWWALRRADPSVDPRATLQWQDG